MTGGPSPPGGFGNAVLLCQQAVNIQQEIGDRFLLGGSWDSLGSARHYLGHHKQAISCSYYSRIRV